MHIDLFRTYIELIPKGDVRSMSTTTLRKLMGNNNAENVQELVNRARIKGIPILYTNGVCYVAQTRSAIEEYLTIYHLKGIRSGFECR